MSVEEKFGVRIPEGDEARPIFASVNALVDHIVKAKATA
jgi:acyl carrier protein